MKLHILTRQISAKIKEIKATTMTIPMSAIGISAKNIIVFISSPYHVSFNSKVYNL